MFRKVFFVVTLTCFWGIQSLAAAKCTNISTEWTLSSVSVDGITSSRIYSDGASYSDGSRGVAASIRCGTFDAVMSLSNGRTFMLNFAGAFLGTSYSFPPPWTNGGAFAAASGHSCGGSPCTNLKILNILNNGTAPRSQYYVLYTRLQSGFVAPDGNWYHMDMQNSFTSDVAPTPNNPTANFPYLNARVVVEHFPSTASTAEYWLVYPESPTSPGSMSPSPQNGVLFSSDRTINYGQFSVPFFLKITVK